VITRSVLFSSLKCTRNRLAAGLCPDPLGSLSAPPHPLAVLGGRTGPPGGVGEGGIDGTGREKRGGEEREMRRGKVREMRREGEEGREGKGRGPLAPLNPKLKLRPYYN